MELDRQAEKEKLQAEKEKLELAREAERERLELANRRIELEREAEKHMLDIELEIEKETIEADRVRADEEDRRALELADRKRSWVIELAELAKDSKLSVIKHEGGGYLHERANITTLMKINITWIAICRDLSVTL